MRTFNPSLLGAGLVAGLALLAAGCQQQYWYQEGKTFDQCKADHEDCWTELLKRTDAYYTSFYRSRFLEDCMRQKGYELVAENDLPLEVKREAPEAPADVPWIHFAAYGVAGALPAQPQSTPPDYAPAEPATPARRRAIVAAK